jgi:hypothetical protein
MNTNLKRIFWLSAIDSVYLNDKQDKFELLKCPRNDMNCKEQVSAINKIYVDAEFFRREKDYYNAIETYKHAFYITTELTDFPCTKCAEVFRATIVESLENICTELKKITSGFLANKKYRPSLTKVENVLIELQNFNLRNKFQLDLRSNERYIENNSQRKVS